MRKLSKQEQRLYTDRLERGQKIYKNTYKAIAEARTAFIQIAPDGILDKIRVYEDDEEDVVSPVIAPFLSFIAKKMMENITALPYRIETMGNDIFGVKASREIQRMIRRQITASKYASKGLFSAFHMVVSGTSITQITTYQKQNRVLMPGKDEPERMGKGMRIIDQIVYDPLRVIPDWNSDPSDITNTSEFIIVTRGDFSLGEITDKYGKVVANSVIKKHLESMGTKTNRLSNDDLTEIAMAGMGMSDSFDSLNEALRDKLGENISANSAQTFTLREYYTADGYYHIFIDDHYVETHKVPNCEAGKIPINFAPIYPNPDSHFGLTLWDVLKQSVVLSSEAINQIHDNVEFNNNAPFLGYNDTGLSANSFANAGKDEAILIDRDPLTGGDINKEITRLQKPEITEGIKFMYDIGQQFAFYLAGTSPLSFGVQDKQVRNEATANMLSSAIVRPDSDVARKLDNGVFNPQTFDMIRIFYAYYEDFDFDKEAVPREVLADAEHIRVVPGSYLPEDKMGRIERALSVAQRALQSPRAFKKYDVEYEVLEAIGVADPDMVLKSGTQIMREQYVDMIGKYLGQSEVGINDPKVQELLQALVQISGEGEQKEAAKNAKKVEKAGGI